MTISILRNKNLTRPRKGGTEGRRRLEEHRKRLISATGMTEDQVRRMDSKKIRTLLKYPAKLEKKTG